MYAFKTGNDGKIELKRICISQSKKFNFEEFEKGLEGKDYQKECDSYIKRSPNHKLYFQRVQKSTLFPFDDKQYYESKIESKP